MNHHEMIDAVVRRVFPTRDVSMPCQESQCNPVCQRQGKCCIAEKSEEQLGYVLSSSRENIFVDACPGSGKTEVVALKASYEFLGWKGHHQGIAILTFTKNAAEVIALRVKQYAGISQTGYPHFVGTLDSWLHGYVAHPFAHLISGYVGQRLDHSIRLVEEGASGNWLNNYKSATPYVTGEPAKLRQMPVSANMLQYDLENTEWEIRVRDNRYISSKDYFLSDEFQFFRRDKVWLTLDYMRDGFGKTKNKFLRDGFATYDDIEWLCYRLLKELVGFAAKLSSRFPLIIVDECQDLSFKQLKILGFLNQAGTKLHFVGDLNQAIYEFRKVDPQRVTAFVAAHQFKPKRLPDSFRSCQPIVDLCRRLVGGNPVRGRRSIPKGPPCVYFEYHSEHLSTLPERFESYLKDRKIKVDKSAILCRGRATVSKLQSLDQKLKTQPSVKLALAIHLWLRQDPQLFADALRNLGDFMSLKCFKELRASSRSYFCPGSVSSPMRWRSFLARILEECTKEGNEMVDLTQTWANWAKCVRLGFFAVANGCREILLNDLPSFATDSFNAPHGCKDLRVIDHVSKPNPHTSNIRITTIHGAKGETFDAVLLVSSETRGQGGHWTEWLTHPGSEHARFAYVASSRPRDLLAWAIPNSNTSAGDSTRLRQLGFSSAALTPW